MPDQSRYALMRRNRFWRRLDMALLLLTALCLPLCFLWPPAFLLFVIFFFVEFPVAAKWRSYSKRLFPDLWTP